MKLGLRRHADTHDPDKGSDPIRITAIRFDIDNEGGWLYIQPNECLDLDFLPDPLSVGGTWGFAVEDASGCGILIGTTTLLSVIADNENHHINTAGGTFAITDHIGSALITFTG